MRSVSSAIILQNIITFHKLRRVMNDRMRLIIYRNHTIFDDVTVKLHSVLRYDRRSERCTASVDAENIGRCIKPVWLSTKGLNSYLVSAYITMLSKSHAYRKSAMGVLQHFQSAWDLYDGEYSQIILIKLRMPKRQFLDYKWSKKLMQMVVERQEADHAMSWLSTLGGAFSALGEEFEHCAKIAGKISVKQFEFALRLDNPLLVARCKLYSALSLIQRGNFVAPRYMIQRIYEFALREKDVRLQNMCQGIWAKLRYNYKQYKQQKRSVSFKTLHTSSKI